MRISQIPYRSAIHPPSFSLFLSSSPPPISSSPLHFSPRLSLPPSLLSPPLDCIFFHHFPSMARSISIVFGTSLSFVPRLVSRLGRFHEFSRNFGRAPLLPPSLPPRAYRVRVKRRTVPLR